MNADFSCADTGGSGLASCVGTVADGQAINTATLGQKTFTVTATDAAGNTRVLDRTYTVVAARPDGRIRRGTGPVVGNDIYNTTGAGQTRTGSATRGQAVTYYVTAQNDAPVAERLRLQGQPSTANFTVVYRDPAGANITTAVTNGTYTTPNLATNGTHQIKIVVTVGNAAPKRRLDDPHAHRHFHHPTHHQGHRQVRHHPGLTGSRPTGQTEVIGRRHHPAVLRWPRGAGGLRPNWRENE